MKTITSLIGRAAAAMCAAALGLTMASCSYDDSALVERLDELEERVSRLEENMASQIASLQQLVDSKTTVVSCELNDGVYTVTLSDGTQIKVDESAEVTGVVGVTEVDGQYYWTVDGTVLTVGGEKVPVTVTPEFRVSTDGTVWEISVDGGTTWTSTGIPATEDSTSCVFSGVTEDDSNVYFTLADGTVITVPKADESSFSASVLVGRQYFAYEETKEVKLSLTDAAKVNVTKPDGWKASVSGSIVTITAPAEANTYAETEGKVLVFVTSSAGELEILEIPVAVGAAPLTVTVDSEGNVTYTVDPDLATDYYNYRGFYYGVTTASEFTPEGILEETASNYFAMVSYEDVTSTIAELYGAFDEEESYVVWCFLQTRDYSVPESPEEVFFVTYEPPAKVIFNVSNITFEDADLSAEIKGAASFYAGSTETEWFNAEDIVYYLNMGWSSYEIQTGNFSGKFSLYGVNTEWGGRYSFTPGTSYTAFAVPIVEGKTEYTVDDVFYVDVLIADYTYGGTAAVTVGTVTATPTSVSAPITLGDDVYKAYVTYIAKARYESSTQDELLAYVLQVGSEWTISDTYSNTSLQPGSEGYIGAVAIDANGQVGPLVCVAANTTDLVYSDVTITAVLDSYTPTSATIKLSGAGVTSFRHCNQTMSSYRNYPYLGSLEAAEEALALSLSYSYVPYGMADVKATDGEAVVELTGLAAGTEYHFTVIGTDSEGNPTKAVELTYTPSIPAEMFVATTDARYTDKAAEFPVVSNIVLDGTVPLETLTSISGYHDVTYDVTAGASCAKVWVLITSSSSYVTGMGERNQCQSLMSNTYTNEIDYQNDAVDGKVTIPTYTMGSTLYVYMMWQDTEGYYYSYTFQDLTPGSSN